MSNRQQIKPVKLADVFNAENKALAEAQHQSQLKIVKLSAPLMGEGSLWHFNNCPKWTTLGISMTPDRQRLSKQCINFMLTPEFLPDGVTYPLFKDV